MHYIQQDAKCLYSVSKQSITCYFWKKAKKKNLSTQGVKPMLQTKHVFALGE